MAVKLPLRFALIGCGNNQRLAHLPRLKPLVERGEVELVACCDPVADNLAKVVAEVPGIRTYADHVSLLRDEQLDAVSISTPHTCHCEQILDSFAAGCHVLTEKPMVCTVDEARAVLAKRDATGLKLQVGYQRHFSGAYRWARQQILSGEAGAVRFVNAWQCQSWRRGQLAKGNSWRLVPGQSGGGQLNDSGSHMVDVLLWLTGLAPQTVSAVIDERECEVDILSAVSAVCDGGAILNLAVVGDSVRQFDEEVVIWCDRMTIQLGGDPAAPVRYNPADEPGKLIAVPAAELPSVGDPDANFVDAILGRAELEVPGECGLRTIELTQAAWESARTGRRIDVAALVGA